MRDLELRQAREIAGAQSAHGDLLLLADAGLDLQCGSDSSHASGKLAEYVRVKCPAQLNS
jgi:hypothetical protein